MKAKDSDLHALLLVGLYQLMAMRVPAYAAVTETVNAAKKLKKPWASGFTNAVLRHYLRERGHFENAIQADEEARYAHPQWWLDKMRKEWPTQWQEVLKHNNEHPPFALRVNQRHLSREAYLHQLKARGVDAHSIEKTQNGLILDRPMTVEELPGFAAGDVTVQDGAAQLAAECLDLARGQRVLDACAAPGGKLGHLLETEPSLAEVIAIDKDPKRLLSVQENMARLHLSATCIASDVAEVARWWDGRCFDRILLDAPCSGSGVVRRHPDIKLLREPGDIERLAKEQGHLLASLWPLLTPGGVLLYVTCSVFSEENTQVIQAFLSSHPDASEEKILATWGLDCAVGRQILPGTEEMDGFYYAKLRKSGP